MLKEEELRGRIEKGIELKIWKKWYKWWKVDCDEDNDEERRREWWEYKSVGGYKEES